MVLTEGFDCPDIGCIILARPTKQIGLFRQMVGRGLRPAPGKKDVVILDHSGAVFRHGLPEDHVEWTLNVDRRAENPTQDRRRRGEEPKLRTCPSCQVMMTKPPCPSCGWMPVTRSGRDRDFLDGELGLVVGGRAKANQYSPTDRRQWLAMLHHIAQERSYQRGWIAHKYKEKFGTWPAWGTIPEPMTPTPEVRSWVRSRQIAYAKSQQNRGAA